MEYNKWRRTFATYSVWTYLCIIYHPYCRLIWKMFKTIFNPINLVVRCRVNSDKEVLHWTSFGLFVPLSTHYIPHVIRGVIGEELYTFTIWGINIYIIFYSNHTHKGLYVVASSIFIHEQMIWTCISLGIKRKSNS